MNWREKIEETINAKDTNIRLEFYLFEYTFFQCQCELWKKKTVVPLKFCAHDEVAWLMYMTQKSEEIYSVIRLALNRVSNISEC